MGTTASPWPKVYLGNGGPDARAIGIIDPLAMTQTRQVAMSGVQGDRATRIQRDGRYYSSSIPDGDVTVSVDGRCSPAGCSRS